MSPERFAAPSAAELNAQLDHVMDKGYDEGKSNLTPIEIIRARALAAAAYTVPSGSVESTKIEKKTMSPSQEIHWYGKATLDMRQNREHDFDLTIEDELNPDMFNTTPPQTSSTVHGIHSVRSHR